MGADTLVWATRCGETISIRVGADASFAVGERIVAHFLPGQAWLFDAATGQRL
jgi:hypothetical protein